jgi:hypothetical protein
MELFFLLWSNLLVFSLFLYVCQLIILTVVNRGNGRENPACCNDSRPGFAVTCVGWNCLVGMYVVLLLTR